MNRLKKNTFNPCKKKCFNIMFKSQSLLVLTLKIFINNKILNGFKNIYKKPIKRDKNESCLMTKLNIMNDTTLMNKNSNNI
jgi:hypothetical protein